MKVTSQSSCLVIIILFHVGIITNASPAHQSDIPCAQRCNLRQGFCHEDGTCRHDELVVKTEGQTLVVIAKTKQDPTQEAVDARCYPGWHGENCNECSVAPGCVHGTCDQPWQCTCEEGWGGRKCEKDLKYCERHEPCENGATCINTNGHFVCVCPQGYFGENCEKIKTTTPVTKRVVDAECNFAGKCTKKDLFDNCIKCNCNAGFAGDLCETNVDECTLRPCANGGKCYDIVNDFYCECLSGFTGRFCSDDIDECAVVSRPCSGNGQCENKFGGFVCHCDDGYSGNKCQDMIKVTEAPVYVEFTSKSTTATTRSTTKIPTTTVFKTETTSKQGIQGKGLLTRITHDLKISTISKNNIPLRSDEIVIQNESGSRTSETMRILTFVFMSLALIVLGIIMLLIWGRFVRTERDQSFCTKTSDLKNENCDPASTQTTGCSLISPSSTTDNSRFDHISNAENTRQLLPQHTVDYDNMQPINSSEFQSENLRSQTCCSPPPPYATHIHNQHRNLEMANYFVELPPATISSRNQSREFNKITSSDDSESSVRRIVV